MKKRQPLLAYFGHHKCATKYILAILKRICGDCGLKLMTVSSFEQVGENLQPSISESSPDVLAHLNAHWQHAAQLVNVRGFHVIRDPRDILVSAYFSHLHSHETRGWSELEAHRNVLRKLDKDQGLMAEMDFSTPVFRAMSEWKYGEANILEVRFERLTSDPYQTFLRVFEHLGLLSNDTGPMQRLSFQIKAAINQAYRFGTGQIPFRWPVRRVPAERVLKRVHQNRFSKRAGGRAIGEEDVSHHFRKGVPGDWKNHFSPEHVREFNRRHRDLLEMTGYDRPTDAKAA